MSVRRGEGEIDGGEEGGMDGWREGEYRRGEKDRKDVKQG